MYSISSKYRVMIEYWTINFAKGYLYEESPAIHCRDIYTKPIIYLIAGKTYIAVHVHLQSLTE